VIQLPEGRRFGSFEHQMCAELVGKAENLSDRFMAGGREMPLDSEREIPLGAHSLRFGDIVALAGDFYAHLDDDAAQKLPWAWPRLGGFAGWLTGDYREPPLATAAGAEPRDILRIVERDKDAKHGAAGELCILVQDSVKGEYPARRYLALASQNFCHFGSQPPDGKPDDDRNTALKLYREYHRRALTEAAAAGDDEQGLLRALATDAFGCHFLTDLFASGHMRVPRRELGEKNGILRGALWRAHRMHKEDNQLGLWVAARGTVAAQRRLVWRAYGDGMLRSDEAQTHKRQVQEAVRRSAAEVFAASVGEAFPAEQTGEWLVPFPLCAGEGPRASDEVLGDADPATTNHYPMYWLLANGHIASRVGGPSEGAYRYKAGFGDERDLDFGTVP
jgi:hypothetical protein